MTAILSPAQGTPLCGWLLLWLETIRWFPLHSFTSASELSGIGTSDPSKLVNLGKRFLDAGIERLMIESEGITENVESWRTDVVCQIMKELPQEQVMFEAADPAVFNWYIREFRIDVNVFIDHSQIVQLEGLRRGIWGKSDTFGKVVSFRPE